MGNLLSSAMMEYSSPDEALLLASMQGNLSRVRELLQQQDCNINATNSIRDQKTPLHLACYRGHLQVCQLLLENGANINAQDAQGTTPILWAAFVCNLELAELLLAYNANVNVKDNEGMMPLHLLYRRKSHQRDKHELIQLLMDHGADVNSKDPDGMTPLNMACGQGHDVALFELLLDHGADVNTKGRALLVSKHPNPPAGTAVQVDGAMTPLHRACQIGHLQVVQLLLRRGAIMVTRSEHGYTPLELAAEGNHLKTTWFLIRNYPQLVSEHGE